MYRDKVGNLYPIYEDDKGRKHVRLNDYEYAPLESLLERDTKQIERMYWSIWVVSYNQNYIDWRYTILGFGPTTIGKCGVSSLLVPCLWLPTIWPSMAPWWIP